MNPIQERCPRVYNGDGTFTYTRRDGRKITRKIRNAKSSKPRKKYTRKAVRPDDGREGEGPVTWHTSHFLKEGKPATRRVANRYTSWKTVAENRQKEIARLKRVTPSNGRGDSAELESYKHTIRVQEEQLIEMQERHKSDADHVADMERDSVHELHRAFAVKAERDAYKTIAEDAMSKLAAQQAKA